MSAVSELLIHDEKGTGFVKANQNFSVIDNERKNREKVIATGDAWMF